MLTRSRASQPIIVLLAASAIVVTLARPGVAVAAVRLSTPTTMLTTAARHVSIIADLCTAPELKATDKWQSITAAGGLVVSIPPGFGPERSWANTRVFEQGHRFVGITLGDGPSVITSGGVFSQTSECETVIANRPVSITVIRWSIEDAPMAPSGAAGEHYAAVARWPAVAGLPTVTVWLASDHRSDLMAYRQVFWTAHFPALAQRDSITAASATAASVAQPCMRAADAAPPLPVDSLVDTTLVRVLSNGSGSPLPAGYGVLALEFDSTGALAGVAVAESNLSPAEQRQLVALVGTNVKSLQGGAPRSLRVRVETGGEGFRYTVLPTAACVR